MKKTILSFCITVLLTVGASAQSLVIKDKSGNVITGNTVEFFCDQTAGYGSFKADVVNSSSTAKTVKVRKWELSMIPEVQGITICWLSCYPPFVFEVPDAMVIEPGATNTNFEGDITYLLGTLGAASTKFVFFDVDNPSDTSFIIVNYNIGNVGVENLVKNTKVSNAYPNPANKMVYIDYKLPAASNNAKIKVSNLLGTTVEVIDLLNTEGKAGVNVSNLKNGVYFYSIMINNSALITRKFIVKR